jgi:hypothetical protein
LDKEDEPAMEVENTIDAGACGFQVRVMAKCEDGMTVDVSLETDCPNIAPKADMLPPVNAMQDCFAPPHTTALYGELAAKLPHAACPVFAGIMKAAEAAAGLNLPKDASIRFVPAG